MKEMDYVLWQEGKYFVSQCLNVNVSSFGESKEEAVSNLKEAVSLFFENEKEELNIITNVSLGKELIYAEITF
jgi:predicted RNase H-like HicB family nuclease